MSKLTKVLLGITTLLPLAYTIFLFASLFLHISSLISGIPKRNVLVEWFDAILVVHLGAMLWSIVLTVFYVVHILRNRVLKNEKKAMWAAIVLLGSVFAMPVYWYLYIWRGRKDSSSA